MADVSMKKLVGVMCDIVVKVASFVFPVDFMILDYEVNFQDLIILVYLS